MKTHIQFSLLAGMIAASVVQAETSLPMDASVQEDLSIQQELAAPMNATKTLLYTVNYSGLTGYVATPPAGYQRNVSAGLLHNRGLSAIIYYSQSGTQPTVEPPPAYLNIYNATGGKTSADLLPIQISTSECDFTQQYNRCPYMYATSIPTSDARHYGVMITKNKYDHVKSQTLFSGWYYLLDVSKTATTGRWTLLQSYSNSNSSYSPGYITGGSYTSSMPPTFVAQDSTKTSVYNITYK